MAIIKLPSGKLYDNVNRIFVDESLGGTPTLSQPIPSFTSTMQNRRVTSRNSLWGRINDFISNIGEWIGNYEEVWAGGAAAGFYIIAWAGLAIAVVMQWISHSFWSALLVAVVGGIAVYYTAMIGAVIVMFALRAILMALRYILYNVYTLLIAIFIGLGIGVYSHIKASNYTRIATSSTFALTPNYYCDVNTTLKVRESPRTNALEIGRLERNQEVYVYSIDQNNFAMIDYNGKIAYASAEYLKPQNAPVTSMTKSTTPSKPLFSSSTSPKSTTSTNSKVPAAESSKKLEGQYTGNRNSKGQRHGEGTYIWTNGDKYVGNWENDKMSGYGEVFYADGKFKNGIWENGVYLGTVQQVASSN